nr:MAG TPA: DNA double-strand break repair protein [Caudoviricetes sp.]
MKIFLKKLTLNNFKGIKEKEIEFTDKTNISGDNYENFS